MIGFAIAILVVAGVIASLSGLFGREMRQDAPERDEVVDPFIGPLDRGDSSMPSGLLRLIDRAVDIHELGEDVRLMLSRCIDPLAIGEPFESLPKL